VRIAHDQLNPAGLTKVANRPVSKRTMSTGAGWSGSTDRKLLELVVRESYKFVLFCAFW